jgi:hypothetical protein
MRSIEPIEKFFSAIPRPSLRDGPHRAALKRELLEQMREVVPPVSEQRGAVGPAGRDSGRSAARGPWIMRPQWAAAAAAAAAVVIVAGSVGVVLLKRHAGGVVGVPQGSARLATTSPSARAEAAAVTRPAAATSRPLLERRGVEGLRRKSLGQSVAEAQVIVVATALDAAPAPPHVRGDPPENFIRFRVVRVLKGHFEQEFVTTRTPTAPAEFIGRDWVVMLSPEFLAGRHSYAGCYTIKLEPEIKAMVDKAGK